VILVEVLAEVVTIAFFAKEQENFPMAGNVTTVMALVMKSAVNAKEPEQ
jgi:hypothetical protein